MNYDQAKGMAEAFRAIGGFSKIDTNHHGFLATLTPESQQDGKWYVELWCVNAKAGNRNLETVETYTTAQKDLDRIARKAKGKSTAADRKAFSRMAAEQTVDNT